jgi:hypothetical protein
VLWFAFGIYIVGVSALLILQPRIMFEQNIWKEFGLHNSTKTTVFPVWMFVLVWSLISYGVASLVVTGLSQMAMGYTPSPNYVNEAPVAEEQPPNRNSYARPLLGSRSLASIVQESQQQESQQQESPQPMGIKNSLPYHRRRLRRRHARPGYYVRNDSGSNGPKYIYYGEEPPQ